MDADPAHRQVLRQFNGKVTGAEAYKEWREWIEMFESYCIVYEHESQSKKYEMLKFLGGPEINRLMRTLDRSKVESFGPVIEIPIFDVLKNRLTHHFESLIPTSMERRKLYTMTQSNDDIYTFIARIKDQVLNCGVDPNDENEIEKEVIFVIGSGANHEKIRSMANAKIPKSINEIESMALNLEMEKMLKGVQQSQHENWLGLNAVAPQTTHFHESRASFSQKDDNFKCFRCGSKDHNAKNSSCPAINEKCKNCGKIGHFKRVCRSAQVDFPGNVKRKATSQFSKSSKKPKRSNLNAIIGAQSTNNDDDSFVEETDDEVY